jgi:Zn-dependent protease with chaperone function
MSTAPLLALAGIVRPRLVISRGVLRALSAEELAAALRHERAHWTARDNLKRLCILLTPGILPFAGSSRTLERGWRKFAEWAADDRAVAGSARRSCALAAALVRVARMTADACWAIPISLRRAWIVCCERAPAQRVVPAPRPMLALSAIL